MEIDRLAAATDNVREPDPRRVAANTREAAIIGAKWRLAQGGKGMEDDPYWLSQTS